MNEESTIRLTDFDHLTGDHHLQMIKAALPYVNASGQRLLSILIRFEELRRTIAFFDRNESPELGIMSLQEDQSRSPADMLNAVKPFADPQEQDFIDMLCNLMEGLRIGSQYQQELMLQEAAGAAKRRFS